MTRTFHRISLATALACIFSAVFAYAGGPRYVAGTAYFAPSAVGKPVVWANGQVSYYTDLGDLSASVNQAQANAMVATAAVVWNTVPTAAVNISAGGSLSEDVNGSNVSSSGRSLTIPADIQSADTAKPVAIVYDEDGSVINAFFGPGSSSAATCQQDGVFTFVDNLAPSGNIVHALILVNGLCATNAMQIGVLQYQLVRAFGQVLGLAWSQTNEEMFSSGGPTENGLQGWPIMHPVERICSASGESCIPNGTTLRPDDIGALNRLYPVTATNIANFSGKELTATHTISVTGTISFRNGQGMQGVNVVLRPLFPGTTIPDVRYTVTAVSGVYFQGDAGNIVVGTTDASGNQLARFGSDDTAVEGYFNLSGIPIPPGETVDTWQLSFEPINPLYIGPDSVGPYATGQVTPSGTLPTISIPGLTSGSGVVENVSIGDSAGNMLTGDDGVISAPVTVPPGGEWTARLAGYSHTSWLQLWVKANREFTVEAEALDDSGEPTLNKAQLVLGAWNGTNTMSAAPVTYTPKPFNGAVAGLTKLPVITLADSEIRIGVADMRGDGRPDYLYRGRVLYADSVKPAILPASGGPIAIAGIGFRPNSTVTVNGVSAQVTSVSPTQITAIAPPSAGTTGTVPVQVEDPQTLGIALIADGVSYGSQDDNSISIVTAPSGAVAPGAPFPFTVAVGNGSAPAAGATVTFAIAQGSATLACGQPSCSVVTAANGSATLAVAANSQTPTSITATLANGASVAATFTGQSGAKQGISPLTPNLYLSAGAAAQWTAQGLVLKNGAPTADAVVTWTSARSGVTAPTTASLSASNGIVTQQIAAGPLSPGTVVPVSACLVSNGSCAQFNVISIPAAALQITPIAGVAQDIAAGQSFTPVTLEVTDAMGDPVAGAAVIFYETLDAWTPACSSQAVCPPAPMIQQQTAQMVSGSDGTVVLNPLSDSGQPVRLYVTAVTGISGVLSFELQQFP